MQIPRILKHLLYPGWMSHWRFPSTSLAHIESAIALSEATHHGEICVAVEAALDIVPLLRGQTARERALEVFARQRVWDTEANNGVLIYLLLADRNVEIVADRGIARHLDATAWEGLCASMKDHFEGGAYEAGVLQAITAISQHLDQLYPRSGEDLDELPNRPIRL
jgi:uncharacterized membrane protein